MKRYPLTISLNRINNYMELKNNRPICEAYKETLSKLGHECLLTDQGIKGSLDGASTDMGRSLIATSFTCQVRLADSTGIGNVMHEVPGFHAIFQIPTDGGAGNHTHGFTAGAGSIEGYRRSIVCATGMATVGVRILTDDELARSIRADFGRERE